MPLMKPLLRSKKKKKATRLIQSTLFAHGVKRIAKHDAPVIHEESDVPVSRFDSVSPDSIPSQDQESADVAAVSPPPTKRQRTRVNLTIGMTSSELHTLEPLDEQLLNSFINNKPPYGLRQKWCRNFMQNTVEPNITTDGLYFPGPVHEHVKEQN